MKYFSTETLRIPLIYALFGLVWILVSDQVLLILVPDVDALVQWQTYKGWLYVILSTLIIFWLVTRFDRQNKAAKVALADSEKRYRLLFNNNPLPMWVYDLETLSFLEVNDAAVAEYGYSRAEFLKQTIKDIRPSEDVPLLLEDVIRTTAPLNFAGEWRHQRKNDTVFPVEIVSHAVVYNGRSSRLVVAKDLSVQKRIEIEKNKIFQRNQALVEALGEIVYEWFPEENVVRWEGQYERILGYSLAQMGSDAESWNAKIHPDDLPVVNRVIEVALVQKQDWSVEYRFLQADGSYRWVLDRGVTIYDDQDALEKVIGVIMDIQTLKQTLAALQSSEERFRKAIEFAPFPILIHAEDGEVLAISQTWLDITGYAQEEISTIDKWTQLAYGPEKNRVVATIERLYGGEGRVDEGEFRVTCKDGSERIWAFGSTPLGRLPDGRYSAISIAVDVTERREAEKQLHLQSSALNAAANGIVVTDMQGNVEWANPAFTELTGYTLSEALGKNPRDLVKSGEHDRAFFQDLWETILSGNVWRGELVNKRKDGTLYVEEEAITPVFNEAGEITHFIAIKQDITRRKEAEKEREQFHRQERLAALGQLAAGIAHDFNNLMAVILLYSQLLARSTQLNPKEQNQLATISQQAKRAARLIEQILDFSRRAVFEKRPLDLLVLLKEEVKLLQRTLPESIEIDLVHEASNYVILADLTRIEQTIMNLAFNARDALPNGGRLQFSLSHRQIEAGQPVPVAGMKPGHWIALSVMDTGTGIDPNVMNHIFEPFVTTKEPGKGTGLGLSQVQGIVAQHGGFIDVRSRINEGTIFDIFLPALLTEVDEPVTPLPQTAVSGQGQRLLVIEDEPALRSALVDSLTLWRYEVLEAANGEEALAMLQAGTAVDLIISDMIMPKMGGLTFAQTLRELGLTAPIIFITGHPLNMSRRQLRALGVTNVLPKPMTPTQLSESIAAALSQTAAGE